MVTKKPKDKRFFELLETAILFCQKKCFNSFYLVNILYLQKFPVSVHLSQSYTCSTHLGVYFHGHMTPMWEREREGGGGGGGSEEDGEMVGWV